MSDRAHSLQVVLTHDIRTDDLDALIKGIKQFRYVADVQPVIATTDSMMAETRAKIRLQDMITNLIR